MKAADNSVDCQQPYHWLHAATLENDMNIFSYSSTYLYVVHDSECKAYLCTLYPNTLYPDTPFRSSREKFR